MSYKQYAGSNWFIERFCKIIDAGFGDNVVETQKKVWAGFTEMRKTTIYINQPFEDEIRKFDEHLICRRDSLTTFSYLWDFCQFIRFCEKVLVYDNDINDEIYVDSDLSSKDEHRFVLNHPSYKVFFKLEVKMDGVTDTRLEVLSIAVQHETGKKLRNEFIVVNGESKYNDDGDVYLMDKMTSLLKDTMIKTIRYIIETIKTDYNNERGSRYLDGHQLY